MYIYIYMLVGDHRPPAQRNVHSFFFFRLFKHLAFSFSSTHTKNTQSFFNIFQKQLGKYDKTAIPFPVSEKRENKGKKEREKPLYKGATTKIVDKTTKRPFFFSLSIFSIAFTHKYTHIQTERMHINSCICVYARMRV